MEGQMCEAKNRTALSAAKRNVQNIDANPFPFPTGTAKRDYAGVQKITLNLPF